MKRAASNFGNILELKGSNHGNNNCGNDKTYYGNDRSRHCNNNSVSEREYGGNDRK
jgi:hypothetical protein